MEGGTIVVPKRWQLTWNGEVYRQGDLTLGDAKKIEELLGLSWLEINPIRSATQAQVLLAYMAAARTGRTYGDVAAEIDAIPVDVFLRDVWALVADDLPGSYTDGLPQ